MHADPIDIPAVPIAKEVDPTGAGDYFDAAFVVGMLEGLSLEQCGKVACAAGAARGPAARSPPVGTHHVKALHL